MCRCRCKLSHWAYIYLHETNNNDNEIYLLEISMQFDTRSPLVYEWRKVEGKKISPMFVSSFHFK